MNVYVPDPPLGVVPERVFVEYHLSLLNDPVSGLGETDHGLFLPVVIVVGFVVSV